MLLSRNALQFDRELSYEEWESIGSELFKVEAAWQWWVGDWINYGEKKYGQTYEQALALTDKSYSTIAHAKSVATEFESCRRRQLSWSHHEAVQGLDQSQQDAILDQAEREGKPRSWVREQVKAIKGEPVEIAKEPVGGKLSSLRILIDDLEPHELVVVMDWIKEKINGRRLD